MSLTAFLYSLLVWLYVVTIQITHTSWVYQPFSHINYFPFNSRMDEIGIGAFALSACGFLIWQIELHKEAV